MTVCDDNFCQVFVIKSNGLSLIIFILPVLVLEFVVHYTLNINCVYTFFI